jgi:phosphoribosylaminoimidazole-succinocarboxamide synthase
MLTDSVIAANLNATLDQVVFPAGVTGVTGKVRDWLCRDDGTRVIVTSDRISAFDRVLGTIPFKGQVLNQLAAFWFEQTKGIAPNHVVSVPDPNIMIVHECEQVPLEFIVRGYITGVTKTSAWTNYKNGVRNLCGNVMPEGMQKDQKFETPIITPTTKLEEHDRNISRDEAIAEGLVDAATFDKAAAMCLGLYNAGVEVSAQRGLIFVDTKYEMGVLNGELIFTDEINTPDSSRYWHADSYEALLDAGEEQRKLDKEYVRSWLAAQGFVGDGEVPVLTDEVRIEAAKRYIQAYEQITGLEFEVSDEPVGERVTRALAAL